jgi:hypothetical protein
MYAFGSFLVFIGLCILAGSICGLVGLIKVKGLFRDIEGLRNQLRSLEARLKEPEVATLDKKEIPIEKARPPVGVIDSYDLPHPQPITEIPKISTFPKKEKEASLQAPSFFLKGATTSKAGRS